MNDRVIDGRCGVLDLLEAAALRAGSVEVRLDDGWRQVAVHDVVGADGEDWLVTTGGERIAVGRIVAARPARRS